MFNADWFHGGHFEQQREDAAFRCAMKKFPEFDPDDEAKAQEVDGFRNQLEIRTLVYLRDGFSYELKEIADSGGHAHLTFECEPVDDQYKVGAFVVTVPYEEIVRVEVFAVHPTDKPSDLPQITGFRGPPTERPIAQHPDR